MNIVVYCSAKEDLPKQLTDAAAALGRWIGEKGHRLVYGGVHSGLMRVTAEAARQAGAEVTGVVPARRRNNTSPLNTLTMNVAGLNDRKAVMQSLADIYVALPGGYGTLDELASSLAHLSFTNSHRPVVIYNPDGFYDLLLGHLKRTVKERMMSPSQRHNIEVAETPEKLIAILDKISTHLLDK